MWQLETRKIIMDIEQKKFFKGIATYKHALKKIALLLKISVMEKVAAFSFCRHQNWLKHFLLHQILGEKTF